MYLNICMQAACARVSMNSAVKNFVSSGKLSINSTRSTQETLMMLMHVYMYVAYVNLNPFFILNVHICPFTYINLCTRVHA